MVLSIPSGAEGPRGPMFKRPKATPADPSFRPARDRKGSNYANNHFDSDVANRQKRYGGESFAPFAAPYGRSKLPLEHDVLHHEGSEMRVEANPAAIGRLTSTLTAAPMLGAAVAAGSALLRRG